MPRGPREPAHAWQRWRAGRDELFRSHPSVAGAAPTARPSYPGVPYFDYDPALRVLAAVEPPPAVMTQVGSSGDRADRLRADRAGALRARRRRAAHSSSTGSSATAAGCSCRSATRRRAPRPTAAAATCSTRSRAPTSASRAAGSSSTSTSPTTRRAATTRAGSARCRRRRTACPSQSVPASECRAPRRAGGGTRTHGIRFTRAVLCQLSYSGALES